MIQGTQLSALYENVFISTSFDNILSIYLIIASSEERGKI